jgi:hypothetical protein
MVGARQKLRHFPVANAVRRLKVVNSSPDLPDDLLRSLVIVAATSENYESSVADAPVEKSRPKLRDTFFEDLLSHRFPG